MRLIDACEYAKELKKEMGWPGRHPEFISAIECAMADLGDMPTIKSDIVLHAKWEKSYRLDHDDNVVDWFRCSECYEDAPIDRYGYAYFSKHCPRCGAIMDLEEENVQ